ESALRSAHSWNATAIKNKVPDAVRTELRLVPVVVSRMEETTMSRKKSTREPTPEEEEEAQQALDAAREAGAKYVQDQFAESFFHDWVWDQMVEAERMRQHDPSSVIPLESKADYNRLARNMLQQIGWDIDRDLNPSDVIGDASREEQK